MNKQPVIYLRINTLMTKAVSENNKLSLMMIGKGFSSHLLPKGDFKGLIIT